MKEPEFGVWGISVPRNYELSPTGIAQLIKRLPPAPPRFAALGVVVVFIVFILSKKSVFPVFQIKKWG